jgi:hypothetical protein
MWSASDRRDGRGNMQAEERVTHEQSFSEKHEKFQDSMMWQTRRRDRRVSTVPEAVSCQNAGHENVFDSLHASPTPGHDCDYIPATTTTTTTTILSPANKPKPALARTTDTSHPFNAHPHPHPNHHHQYHHQRENFQPTSSTKKIAQHTHAPASHQLQHHTETRSPQIIPPPPPSPRKNLSRRVICVSTRPISPFVPDHGIPPPAQLCAPELTLSEAQTAFGLASGLGW